jgi:hypothetical protein
MKIERTVALLAGQRAAILVDDAGRRYIAPLHERDGRLWWRPIEAVPYGEAADALPHRERERERLARYRREHPEYVAREREAARQRTARWRRRRQDVLPLEAAGD